MYQETIKLFKKDKKPNLSVKNLFITSNLRDKDQKKKKTKKKKMKTKK